MSAAEAFVKRLGLVAMMFQVKSDGVIQRGRMGLSESSYPVKVPV